MFNIIDFLIMFSEIGILEYKEICSFPIAKKRVFFIKFIKMKLLFCSY